MNNRGQIFALFLVFITAFLCISVVLLYGIQQKNAEASLVSPRVVLEARDDLELFEMREKALVDLAWENSNGDIDVFRRLFFDGFFEDERMVGFVFENLDSVDGAKVNVSKIVSESDKRNLIESGVYPKKLSFVEEDGDVVFGRAKIGKWESLDAKERSKINFGAGFGFEFEKKYVLLEDGRVL